MKMSRKMLLGVLFSVLSVFLLFLFFAFSGSVLSRKYSQKLGKGPYRISEFNPLTKRSRVTVHSSIPAKFSSIREKGYVFSKNRHFISLLPQSKKSSKTSSFRDVEYTCRGRCQCQQSKYSISNEDYERRIISAIPSSLIFMISAVSTTVAITMSRKYFNEECERLCRNRISVPQDENGDWIFSDDPDTQLRQLKEILDGPEPVEEGEWAEVEECTPEEREKMSPENDEFACWGKCADAQNLPNREAMKMVEAYACEQHELERTVWIPKDFKTLPTVKGSPEPEHDNEYEARIVFRKQYFDQFCAEQTNYEFPSDEVDEETGVPVMEQYGLCSSQVWEDGFSIHSNIICLDVVNEGWDIEKDLEELGELKEFPGEFLHRS